jgi:nitrogen fixation/metabolism regulation signal transduction histidine kinase
LTAAAVVRTVGGKMPLKYWAFQWAARCSGSREKTLDVKATRLGLAGTLIAVLGLALAVATALAARMSRPLRELTRATQDLLRPGEPPRVVAVRSRDEIGTLASAFNTMGTALARAQDDLLVAAKWRANLVRDARRSRYTRWRSICS